ncbi:MAG: hypothetical protein KJO64_06505 [Bacteroidia bacterium]|nr:hypothetical protein [Bacteroidia bacterium]NNC85634.1 hypothetical protein [Bacteroidia bacterium]
MFRLKDLIFFFLLFLFSCGETTKEKAESDRLQADSLKNARQNMIKAEQNAAARLDSIKQSK